MNKLGLTLLATAAVLSATMCSAEKEKKTDPQPATVSYIRATFSDKGISKTTIDGFTPHWETGDRVALGNGEQYGIGIVERVEANGDGIIATTLDVEGKTIHAIYPEEAGVRYSDGKLYYRIPEEQDGSFASANICCAKGDSKMLEFKNATSIFKITGKDESIASFIIPIQDICGTFSVEFSEGELNVNNDETSSQITVTPTPGNSGPYYIAVAPTATISESDLVASFVDVDGVYAGVKYAAGDKNLQVNYMYSLGEAEVNNGYIYDEFGDACLFAHGNLYCTGTPKVQGYNLNHYYEPDTVIDKSTATWGLYAKQYQFQKYSGEIYQISGDLYGQLIVSNSPYFKEKDTISLFTWGYSDSTSYHPSGVPGTIWLKDTPVTPISAGDFEYENDWASNLNPVGQWRTPSYDEMDYIFANHITNYSHVEVEEGLWVYARIIMPINWPGSTVHDELDFEEWSMLEMEGATLLPDAYMRRGSLIVIGKESLAELTYGIYWTSSYNSTKVVRRPSAEAEGDVDFAGPFWFQTRRDECYNLGYWFRYESEYFHPAANHGASVRPVKNIGKSNPGFNIGGIDSGEVFFIPI